MIRRYPATAGIAITVLVVGVATGALWHDISHDESLWDAVAYGLPPLREGRWWTNLTGAFFVPQLVLYLPVVALLIGAAAPFERRAGHWQTLLIVVGGQAAASTLTSLLLWPFEDSGWSWAVELAHKRDVGISAGGFAAFAALTASLDTVWRTRVRATVSAYLVAMLLQSGLLWDVEHLLAWTIGLVAGPFLLGRRPQLPKFHFGRRTQRSIVALIIAVQAVATLIEAVFPGNGGPFWPGDDRYVADGVTFGLAIFDFLMLLLADGLRRGRRVAWVLTTVLVGLSFVSLLSIEGSAERTAELVIDGALLVLLLMTARAFSARTKRAAFRSAGRRLALVAFILFAYTAFGFWVLRDDFEPRAQFSDALTEFVSRLAFTTTNNIEPMTQAARWFVGSIGFVWLATIILTAIGMLYSSRRPDTAEREVVGLRSLLAAYPSSSIEWMLTWRGNEVWRSPDGNTAIGYRVIGSVALCLADPVGPPERRLEALRSFDEFCFQEGWIPCLFAAGSETTALAPQLRWKAVQVAEDSIVHLPELEFRGKAWQDIRTALNRAGKEGIELRVTHWADCPPAITDQLRMISQEWVSDKALPEMGFTLGSLVEAADPEVRLHLAVAADGTVEGFTSWMPIQDQRQTVGWTVDLMRRRDQGFRPVMEFLIGASALQFKDEGFSYISLSAAPLAKAPERLSDNDQDALQHLLDFLGTTLEPYYGFRSLLAFKAKFQPEFRPLYLVFPDETALAEIGLAITRAYMPDATMRDWLSMGWEMVRHKSS